MNDIVIENVELTSVPQAEFDEVPIPEKSQRLINFSLPQENKFRRSKRLCYVFDRTYLAYKNSRKRNKEIVSDLRFLDENLDRSIKVSWKILGIGLFLLLSTLFVHRFFTLLPLIYTASLYASAVFLIVLSIYNSSYRIIIRTKHGQLKVAELYINLPDKKSFLEFTGRLQKEISEAQNNLPGGNRRFAMEMTEHRRIFESGAVKQEDYSQAKENILACFKQ